MEQERAAPGSLHLRVLRAVPSGLVGMLCLIAAVESLMERHEQSLTTVVAANSRFAARKAETEATSCRLLVFGDSQVKCGVDPKIIEDCLNVRAYNLAIL